MKKLLYFIFLFLSFETVFSQGAPACPQVITAPTQTICNGQCAGLTSTLVTNFQTTSYSVSSIPYAPYPYTGVSILANTDDIWSDSLAIGFNFCFFGNTYNKFLVGAN